MLQDTGDTSRLVAHGERVRKSGVLGKSQPLNRLFELLLERSLAGMAPKEIEIAQIVFGKSADENLSSDASVRVHLHRLRKKLDELPADENGERITLQRGQYRLIVIPAEPAEASPPAEDAVSVPVPPAAPVSPDLPVLPMRQAWRWYALAGVLLAVNGLGWFWFMHDATRDARLGTIFWSGLANKHIPALIVVGDQYVFGEQDANGHVLRVIADPAINSREDLDQYKSRIGGADRRYIDLNAHHLPEGLAPALASIATMLAPAQSGKANLLQSIAMSRFTNDMLRSHHIVYLGLLRNLGDLHEPLSDISGFSLEELRDDIIVDRASGRRFQSDWSDPSMKGIMRTDYAYLASLPGPSGNRVLVLAGTHDPALMEAAQIASSRAELDELAERLASRPATQPAPRQSSEQTSQQASGIAFEALYEVRTFGPSNVSAKLLMARRLEVAAMWPGSDLKTTDTGTPRKIPAPPSIPKQ